jgi:sugar lactone lactonase YvrE
MRLIAGTILLLGSLVGSLVSPPDDVAESRRHQAAAMEARRAGDAAAFLSHIAAASALRPQHGGLLYQLAVAQAMNGHPDQAVAALERTARLGFAFDPEEEAAFASIRETAAFRHAAAAFQQNRQPVGKPAAALTFQLLGQLDEGIAFDPSSGRTFLSSVRTRRIFDAAGGRVFAKDLPYGVFGMAVDSKRGALWAATSALPQMDGFTGADRGKAAVVKLSLRDGRLLETFTPEDGEPHQFGDLALAPNGDVFTTNGDAPIVYRVSGGRIEPFVRGPFDSLQGIAVARDGRTRYVADNARGLFAIDRHTRDLVRLPVPDGVTLLGTDGLYASGTATLIATQNGTNPARVLRIVLDGLRVVSVDVLAANDPRMTDVTLGVLRGDDFDFIANAQWGAWNDDGTPRADAKLEPVTVLRVRTR